MGFRVIKTAIATLIAILAADTAGLPGAMSAGLLAILGVDVTRKRSLKTVSARFFASVVGLVLCFILFRLVGFHIWVLIIYILIGFPLIARMNFKEGIVTSSVCVFRVYSGSDVSLHMFMEQILLLVIGLGSAMLVNLVYMPKDEDKLASIRQEVNHLFAVIFKHIAGTLRNPEDEWSGEELILAEKKIESGMKLAKRSLENQVIHTDESWAVYFYMRGEHLDRVESMMELVSRVYRRMPQAELAAQVFDQLSEDVLKDHYTGQTESRLRQLEADFKDMDLPTTREEFEMRAAILQLCRELNEYLNISKRDKKPMAAGIKPSVS
ncbi:aromatic acid exporter family protein [Paenibacillus pinistramenti]|uniref:aromatic acid exporter family protein n=1 Tax=Paenibacillus pinistramenti TaxID=1768003 RepID=UPI0011083581|nr:aromatic acid exporter family protein [Paenibacillus pinistramenti]